MLEIAIIGIVVAGGWLLWDSLKAREAANAAIRPACRAAGFLFLDDTVALERMRPARNEDGRMRVGRVYRFDYSDTGDNRRRGRVSLLGAHVLHVDLADGAASAGSSTGATLH